MILIISDTHLRPRHHAGVKLEGDCVYAIKALGEWCRENKPEACLHGGDIFGMSRASGEELKLWHMLNEEVGCPMYYVPGNHERDSLDNRASLAEGTRVGTRLQPGQIYEIDGYRVTGLDGEMLNRGLREKLPSVPMADILVMHSPLKQINSFSNEALDIEEIPKHKLIICGDTHKTWMGTRKDGSTVVSPGCLFPQNKTELLEADRSCGFATYSNGQVQLHRLKHRKVFSLPRLTEALIQSISAQADGLPPVVFAPADQVFPFERKAKEFGVILGREKTAKQEIKDVSAVSVEASDDELLEMAGKGAGLAPDEVGTSKALWMAADPVAAIQALTPPDGE